MPSSSCAHCGQALLPGDLYCPDCGQPAGRIEWSLAPAPGAPSGVIRLRPGGRFYLVARNSGVAAAPVDVDPARAQGVHLLGAARRRVNAGQAQAFELAHVPEEEIRGSLLARSEDGPRAEWWERRSWRAHDVRLTLRVVVREEQWVGGSPALLFPPGVRRQYARVWNDAETERSLETESPAGYLVTCGGEAGRPLPVAAGGSVELAVASAGAGPERAADTQWHPFPEAAPTPILRLASARPDPGADVVVAIDFGTRNTGVRVRWRRPLAPGKPAGTVDAVGDRGDTARFPTQMVLHRQGRTFRWGTEAAEYIAASRMTEGEAPVLNLKTLLREGQQRFTEINPEWTNEALVTRYFERIIHRLDEYFRTADPDRPLFRRGMDVRFVVCRPVLDANEGDEKGRRYEEALRAALVHCDVPAASISFVQEPVAAAIGIARRRAEGLLGLPDGTAVAVVDSGGGTTDVALARVRLHGGRVSLDIAGSAALWLAAENPALAALEHWGQTGTQAAILERQLGGNTLDWALAWKLATAAAEVLESSGKALPDSLWQGAVTGPAVREFVLICRRMKERFARVSTQYLNRPTGEPREPGEVLPFPNRPDLQGVYLLHDLYDQRLLGPILDPVVEALSERLGAAQSDPEGVRPSEVQRVFYVGGTNVDPFVRLHFSRAFPLARGDDDAEAQSDARISERLNAVVEGAVWFDEQLYAPSPLSLAVRVRTREETLVLQGAALPPKGVAAPRFLTDVLEPGEELDAALVASGGGLAEPTVVARGFYRNETPDPQDLSLALVVSHELGATAELQAGDRRLEQWRFALVEPRV
jgi:hypothetical protein